MQIFDNWYCADMLFTYIAIPTSTHQKKESKMSHQK
jgi:hypothetical protein